MTAIDKTTTYAVMTDKIEVTQADRGFVDKWSFLGTTTVAKVAAQRDMATKALQWIIDNGDYAHPANMVGVAEEALSAIAKAEGRV